MTDRYRFTVLRECRNLLKIINLSNKNSTYFGLYEISSWLFSFTFLFSLNLLLIFCVWFCSDNDFNLESVIWAMNLIAAIVQMEAIYLCLISKKNLLIDTIESLHILTNRSMFVFFFYQTKDGTNSDQNQFTFSSIDIFPFCVFRMWDVIRIADNLQSHGKNQSNNMFIYFQSVYCHCCINFCTTSVGILLFHGVRFPWTSVSSIAINDKVHIFRNISFEQIHSTKDI